MNTTKNFLIAIIITSWLVFIATFSIQNIQLISVKFLIWESIQIPVGTFLTIVVGFGFLLGAILPIIFSGKKPKKKVRTNKPRNDWQRERELEEESDPIFDW